MGKNIMDILKEIADCVIKGDHINCAKLSKEALDSGIGSAEILNKGLVAGMDVVGEKFKCQEMFIPEVLVAARAMQKGMDVVKPSLLSEGSKPLGKIVIGTVQGDLHDIGKNLVAMMMEGAGFQVIDLGADVEPEKFVEAARLNEAQIVGMSALLTTTMPMMKNTIEMISAAGLSSSIYTMVGGAPLSKKYADEIGANAYAEDAVTAVEKAKQLLRRA